MVYYRRKLPHLQIKGGEYFITFRLHGSLPQEVIKSLQRQKKLFKSKLNKDKSLSSDILKYEAKFFLKYEELLENNSFGPTWLSEPHIARIVAESILFRDQKEYDLYAFCIMSNHVHLVFRHLETFIPANSKEPIVTNILRRLKRFTGLNCNRALQRNGAFWHPESYDRLIRDNNELENVIAYTLNNPVKANLTAHWKDWPNSYCKPEFLDDFK